MFCWVEFSRSLVSTSYLLFYYIHSEWLDIFQAQMTTGKRRLTDLATILGGDPLGRKIYAPEACKRDNITSMSESTEFSHNYILTKHKYCIPGDRHHLNLNHTRDNSVVLVHRPGRYNHLKTIFSLTLNHLY